MMDELKAIVKKILAPAVSAVTAVYGYRLLFPLERPHWVGLFIVLGLSGVGVSVLFIRRLLARRSAFHPGETAQTRAAAEGQARFSGVKLLQREWARAIATLKASHLQKQGDAVYALPWYMLLGDFASGKTTALRAARLATFVDAQWNDGTEESGRCDWSFFERSIVIDTAGRYVAGRTEDDRLEWSRVLDLLYKHRKKEPLNGLVVTLSAERLLQPSTEALEAYGNAIRQRIDDLMRALGAKFPVYVLVTKCDLVPGLVASFSELSEAGRRQAMGCVNQALQKDMNAFVTASFFALGQRLKSLRLVAAQGKDARSLAPEQLLFPNAFARLEMGVAAFVRGAFGENPYQETPLLRGLYFSAAPAGAGYGLHEFFASALPADRALFVPTKRAIDWWKKTITLGVAAWLAFLVAFGGLLTYSFVANLTLLRSADRQFAHLPAPEGDFLSDLVTLDRIRQAILSLNDAGVGGWLPSFGLHESARVKEALEEKLSSWFWQGILVSFDQQNAHAMSLFTRRSPDASYSLFVEHLVDRLLLIRARLAGETLDGEKRQAPLIPSLKIDGREANDDVKAKFAGLCLSSTFWLADSNELRRKADSLLTQIKNLLAVKGDAPQWVIAWATRQSAGAPLALGDFWGVRGELGQDSVPAIFLRKDKTLVDAFFAEIEMAMDDHEAFSRLHAQYESWYRANAFDAWHRFLIDFPRGARGVQGAEAWKKMAARVVTDDGPYFKVLNVAATELEPLASSSAPGWLSELYRFRSLESSTKRASVARLGLSKIGIDQDKSYTVAASLKDYRQALKKVLATVLDAGGVAAAVGQALEGGATPGSSPFADAQAALDHVQTAMAADPRNDPAIWRIISGPLDFLWAYAQRETGEEMQTLWEKKVLTAAAGIPAGEVAAALLAPDGAATKFAQEQAAPFVQWKPGHGYGPKQNLGGQVPFTGGFFSFLNSSPKISKASKVLKADVVVTAVGAESNAGASRTPSSTELTLDCGKKSQVLANHRPHLLEKPFNVVAKPFAWTPTCGDTTLEIGVAGVKLVRRYPGAHGFLEFLKEFQSGDHTYPASEFSSQAAVLSPAGIQSITVRYQIQGGPEEIPDYSAPSPIPMRIVQGWDR